MNLDERKKRMLAIGGGVTALLIVILIIIRAAVAGGADATPTDFSCDKNGTTASIKWQSKSGDKGLIKYGLQTSGELPFIHEEATTPIKAEGGLYQHSVGLDSLLDGSSYIAAVSGFEEKTVVCKDENETAADSSQFNSLNSLAETLPSPTEEPVETPTETPTLTSEDTGSSLLPLVDATAYFNDNTTATLLDCVEHFSAEVDSGGNPFYGLAHICAVAWKAVNTSS